MDPTSAQHLADAYMNAAKYIGAGLAAIGMGAPPQRRGPQIRPKK